MRNMNRFTYYTVGYLPTVYMEARDGDHFYRVEGKEAYPSVTTILKATSDTSGLEAWEA